MERERRLLAASLVAVLAFGLWYVWDDGTEDKAPLPISSPSTQPGLSEATPPPPPDSEKDTKTGVEQPTGTPDANDESPTGEGQLPNSGENEKTDKENVGEVTEDNKTGDSVEQPSPSPSPGAAHQQLEETSEPAPQPTGTEEQLEQTAQRKDIDEQPQEPTAHTDQQKEESSEPTPQPTGTEEQLEQTAQRKDIDEQPQEPMAHTDQQKEESSEPTPQPTGTEEQLEQTAQRKDIDEQPQEPTAHTDKQKEESSEPTPQPLDTNVQPQEQTPQPHGTGGQQKEQASDQADKPLTPAGGDRQEDDHRETPTKTKFQDPHHNICPPESAEQPFDNNGSGELSNSVFIVNGLSSIGARVANSLARSNQWEVLSIASSQDRLCGDQLIWYRQDMLREAGIRSIFVDWSDASSIGALFEIHRPSHVIIVPPNVGGGGSGYTLNAATWAASLHNFVALLETTKTVSPDTRLTLVSVSKSVGNELEVVVPMGKNISLLETLVGAFELTLSTYHTLYHIPFSVIRLKGVYGPWTNNGLSTDSANLVGCFIDDIVATLQLALALHSKCVVLDLGSCGGESSTHALGILGLTHRHLTSPAKARHITDTWKREYESRKGLRLILTSYFTGHGLHAAPNRFQRLRGWLESVTKISGVDEAVVLHNGLRNEFMERCREHYPGLQFESVSLPFDFGRNSSSCRQSVLAFANYLESRANVASVLVTDVDRNIKTGVFPAMELLGDWLYSDLDMIEFRDLLGGGSGEQVVLTNSLVLGGSRHMVLATLNKMADCLQGSQSAAALNCLLDENFIQHAVMGWPLSITVK